LKTFSCHEYRDNLLKGEENKEELYRSMVNKHQLEPLQEITELFSDDDDEEEEEDNDTHDYQVSCVILLYHTTT
jgi:hypothetical protein